MNKVYKLKASTTTKTKWTNIVAYDDMNAQMHAITYILDEAMSSPVWAKGAITLTAPDGRLVAEMGAK
jgi:hypothetical protein